MKPQQKPAVEIMREAWGDEAPDWIVILAEQRDATSQRDVAARIGYSPAVVSTVLKRQYKGDLTAVEQAARGALLSAKVTCPVIGELQANRCLEFQRRPFAATNPERVRLYKACRNGCPHSRVGR